MKAIEVCTTTGTRAEAQHIARLAVERSLCACAHIDEIESFYRWHKEIQHETEHVMMKCSESVREALEELIRANHSYEEPAIYTLPITGGSQTYLRWIVENSSGPEGA